MEELIIAKRTRHKGTTRFISLMLSVLLAVNTLGISAFAAEGTVSTPQTIVVSELSEPAQDSEAEPEEDLQQAPEDVAKEELPRDPADETIEEQLEAPVREEGVTRDAASTADDKGGDDPAEIPDWTSPKAAIDAAEEGAAITVLNDRIATWSQLQDALDDGGEQEWFPPGDENGDWIHIIRLTDDIKPAAAIEHCAFNILLPAMRSSWTCAAIPLTAT